MNFSSPPRLSSSCPSSPSSRAFTLIELLVVMSIIAILMGLLFPAAIGVGDQSKRVQAKTETVQIVAAVKAYESEYGHLPAVAASASNDADVLVGEAAAGATIDNSALFNTLRAIPEGLNADHKLNPRRISFLEGKSAKDTEHPRGGFADHAGDKKGCFFDPWGQQYTIVLDTNYDRTVSLKEQYSDFAAPDVAPRVSAAAFSLGKDGKLGKAGDKKYHGAAGVSDDVLSWQ